MPLSTKKQLLHIVLPCVLLSILAAAAALGMGMGKGKGQPGSHPTAQPDLQPPGAAWRFNAFVLNDFSARNSATEGRLAAGGAINLNHYSVGRSLNRDFTGASLISGGDIVFPSGRVARGDILAAGSIDGVGRRVIYGLKNGQQALGDQALALSFTEEFQSLTRLSAHLADLDNTGQSQFRWSRLELEGDCESELQVFAIDGDELRDAHSLHLSCIPRNATLVLNVSGQQAQMSRMGMGQLNAFSDRLLFNFHQAEQLTLSSIAIRGSLLAPAAQVNANRGVLKGSIIAQSWDGTMTLQQNPFVGNLPQPQVVEGDPNRPVWLASDNRIVSFVPGQGLTQRAMDFGHGVEQLLVDDYHNRLLVKDADELHIWSLDRDQDLVLDEKRSIVLDGAMESPLSLNAATGELAYAHGDTLSVVSVDQGPVYSVNVTGLSAFTAGDKAIPFYTASGNEIQGWSPEGELALTLTLSHSVESLAYDDPTERLWALGQGSLSAHDGQTPILSTPVAEGEAGRIIPNGQGGLWLTGADGLFRLNDQGAVEPVSESLNSTDQSVADPSDGGLWHLQEELLHYFDAQGELLGSFPLPAESGQTALERIDLYSDTHPPVIAVREPEADALLDQSDVHLRLSVKDPGLGLDEASIDITLNQEPLTDCQFEQNTPEDGVSIACFAPALDDGNHTLAITASDTQGNTASKTHSFQIDTSEPLALTLDQPQDGSLTNQQPITLTGRLNKAASLEINNNPVSLDTEHGFETQVSLEEGQNTITLVATTASGERLEQSLLVTLDTLAPEAPATGLISTSLDEEAGEVTVTGAPGSVEANSTVTVTNTRTGESQTATADDEGAFSLSLAAQADDQFEITSRDQAGNHSDASPLALSDLPPDPAAVAPPLSQTGVTPFAQANEFLYSGSNPIQTGVAPGTIEARRIAVIRGRVLNRQNEPLTGVTITVKDRPQLGQTASRRDGRFDLAANGGGTLTLNYEKEGYLPVQRKIPTVWRDYAFVDDVVMIPLDDKVTSIDLSAGQMQVARGSEETDADGSRQFTMLFPQGVTASMTLPDGSTQELTNLDVRATEYTLGENGPEAMPGELPATSGYTYAVELSVDQALAAGAKRVDFSQPIPTYVDNFLDFPTGEIVPLGYYDRDQARWVGSDNGRVVEILAIENGQAVLDVNGDGQAATEHELEEFNIAQAERQQLAELYEVGQSFWRAPIPHFTPWDHNWPVGPPEDAERPDVPRPDTADENEPEDSDEECTQEGCVIGGQGQTLGERIDLVGTSLNLAYQSERTAGFNDNRVEIAVTGSDLPASVAKVRLTVEIAGRRMVRTFGSTPNQTYTFEWDGKDGFGRDLVGPHKADILVSYQYPCVSFSANEMARRAWSQVSIALEAIGSRNNCSGIFLSRNWSVSITAPKKIQANSVNQWSLSNHHSYDIANDILYLGDGKQKPVKAAPTIEVVAGSARREGFTVDGEVAEESTPINPGAITFDPAGNLYFHDGDLHNSRIRRINGQGIIETVAGIGERGFSANGTAALEAKLDYVRDIAIGPNGNVYYSEDTTIVQENGSSNGVSIVRMIDSAGIIKTVAGGGESLYAADGGLATNAELSAVRGITVDNEGNLYLAELGSGRVRKVDTDGIISTFAGRGGDFHGGDGGQASRASLKFPRDVAIDSLGNVYILTARRIRMVSPNGVIRTAVGTGSSGDSGDGGLAIFAELESTRNIAVDTSGNLYITDRFANRVRKVNSKGIITTAVGTGEAGGSSPGSPAENAQINYPDTVATNGEDQVYVSEIRNNRIIRISKKGATGVALNIPSKDGTQLYGFNEYGRHQVTLDATTKNLIYQFDYNQDDLLTQVTDADGNIITIERNAQGNATALVAPDGQRTEFGVNQNGMLNQVTDPQGNRWAMQYTDDDLLTRFEDPKGNVDRFEYNADGRLIHNSQPNGGSWDLARTSLENGFQTQMTSAEGQVYNYAVERSPTGERIYTDTAPDGTVTERRFTGVETNITRPDGTQIIQELGPDPRFDMMAPVTTNERITTPGGLVREQTRERTAELADDLDSLSHTALSEASRVNGRSFRNEFEADSRTWTLTSPEGRTRQQVLDAKGRPIEIQTTGLAPTQLGYDERGRLTGLLTGEGSQQRSSSLSYDSLGNLASVTDALGRTVNFEYDLAGRVTEQTLPDGRSIGYQYDANGNLTAITPPGREAHLFNYNGVDLETNYTPPELSGATTITQYHYDLDRRLTRVERPDGRNINFEYNTGGKLASADIERGIYSYTYDQTTGQLATLTAPDGGQLTYTFDGLLPLSETWSGTINGGVSRDYDNNFWLQERCVNGGDCVAFDYDDDGLLTQAGSLTLTRDPNHGLRTASDLGTVSSEWQYTNFGELDSYLANVSGSALAATDYERDNLGRITRKVNQIQGQETADAYSYDEAGRLTAVTRNGETTTWTYDANGNRTHENGDRIAIYDEQDRLLTYRDASYEYTANGELLSKTQGGATTHYTYDEFSNLTAVSLPGDIEIDYLIDGQNRRIGKKVNGELTQGFLYGDQLNPIAELDENGAISARFVYAEKPNVPAYMVKGGETYRIISDHLGSPRLVLNTDTGEVAQRMDYDVWGKVTQDTNPGFQPFGFAGGIYDQHTGLVRFGARDYDPETGRWTAKDPIRFDGGFNAYSYAEGDPINNIDLDGLKVAGAACFALINTASIGVFANDFKNSNEIAAPLDDQIKRIDDRIREASQCEASFQERQATIAELLQIRNDVVRSKVE